MRLVLFSLLVIVLLMGLTGCNLSQPDDSIVVTATLSGPIVVPSPAISAPPTLSALAATFTPVPSPTPQVTPSALPATAKSSVPPTVVLTPVPTRTVVRPPTVLPLDDGSGQIVPNTGNNPVTFSPVPGVDALPATLYYLSEQAGLAQVWRLPYGLGYPEQLSFSPTGVMAFDVAPDGTLAYITSDGILIIDGLPLLPPAAPTGALPQVTALAWSPAGDWLAYVLSTPGAAESRTPIQAVDGVWIRNRDGQEVLLSASEYAPDAAVQHFTGPIDWRPGGSEFLIRHELARGGAFSRVDIVTGALTPVWNESVLAPGSFERAGWSATGAAIITSGAAQVLSVEPDSLASPSLLARDSQLWIESAQQLIDGTLIFLAASRDDDGRSGPLQLYRLPSGASSPQAITAGLTQDSRADFLWDATEERALIVVYPTAGAPMGAATLRDADGTLHDLEPLTGPVGSPQWGPHVKPGDSARVQATQGDSLNVRAEPGGQILVQLANGARVSILGGPRIVDGLRWWWVRTTDGISGWAAESVTSADGERLWTLLPAP